MNNPRFQRPGFIPPPPASDAGGGGGGVIQRTGGSFTINGTMGPLTVARGKSLTPRLWVVESITGAPTGASDGNSWSNEVHQTMLAVSSGTDKGNRVAIYPAGKPIQVVGQDISVDAFLTRQDSIAVRPEVSVSGAAWVAESDASLDLIGSRWIEPAKTDLNPQISAWWHATISALPCTMWSIFGTNLTATEGTILIYDSPNPNAANSRAIFLAVVAGGASFSIDLPRGRRCWSGLSWAVSSSRTTPTNDITARWRVDAEIA
jgi:hypothetical protein